MTDRFPEGEAGQAQPESAPASERPVQQPVPRPGVTEAEAEAVEHHKAETEIAAGDVADDLADFA